jgi:hypothetical protein
MAARIHADDSTQPFMFSESDAVVMACRIAESQAFRWWPDVVFIVSGFYVTPGFLSLLRARGITTVVLCTESPYEDDKQIAFAPQVDYVLLNDPTNLAQYREHNPNTFYVPHAYDPKIHTPGPRADDLQCDFGFCGTGYPSRREFFEQVDFDGIDVKLAGHWKNSPTPLAATSSTTSKTASTTRKRSSSPLEQSLSEPLPHRSERDDLVAGWAMGRVRSAAAIGTFFLRDPRGRRRSVPDAPALLTEPGDFGDKLRWWLDHPAEREKAALAARAAIEDRTFSANAAWLAGLLDN